MKLEVVKLQTCLETKVVQSLNSTYVDNRYHCRLWNRILTKKKDYVQHKEVFDLCMFLTIILLHTQSACTSSQTLMTLTLL